MSSAAATTADAASASALHEVTVSAPVNIAVIKYWGKRCAERMLPTNSSLSLTLSQDVLQSRTSARADPEFDRDRLWLNGVEESLTAPRMQAVLEALRTHRKRLEQQQGDAQEQSLSSLHLHIVSENNFPTAAGLASSASGFAALVYALAQLYQLPLDARELSKLARLGSGSACRSMMGGYVKWEMGEQDDGEDSAAVQVASELDWPDIEALVLVVNDARKATPSTLGMQNTVTTSPLFPTRVESVVPQRIEAISQAIRNRDFNAFAEITMRDSNQFHAVCLDSWPPVSYMNDVSRAIVACVHEVNNMAAQESKDGSVKYIAAYTYDAGPNAVIYAPRQHIRNLVTLLCRYFPAPTLRSSSSSSAALNDHHHQQHSLNGSATTVPPASDKHSDVPDAEYFGDHYGVFADPADEKYPFDHTFIDRFATFVAPSAHSKHPRARVNPLPAGSVKRILHVRVGDGPRLLQRKTSTSEHSDNQDDVSLLNCQGMPRRARD
ncbi:diphosphomevalonate decarboxylase [Sorochytrium milnesiophthora]